MNHHRPIHNLLVSLWVKISPRRHRQFGLLLLLMIFTSFSEVLTIGATLPFLGALTAPEHIYQLASMQPVIKFLGLTLPKQIILPMTILFGLAAVIAGAMRLLTLWASTRLAFAAGADLSIDIYRRTLYQTYAVHCARNSSEVINGISTKVNSTIYNVILPILTMATSSTVLISILMALLLIQPTIAIAAFAGFGLIYMLIIFLTRKQLLIDSQKVAQNSTLVIKSLQEGLGGIRDVLIDGSQATYCNIFRDADSPLRRAQGNQIFIGQSPRYAIEALGMILIAILAFALSEQNDGITKAIPVLGALAFGAQRLLPVLQQTYGSWTSIRSGQVSLQDTLKLLDQPLPDYVDKPSSFPISFQKQITLNQISFRYSADTPWVLKDLNLTITKGSRVGFIGTTGSGKSTLMDITMGLLKPTGGNILIDNIALEEQYYRGWQAHIAHVPQAIFLADTSIAENIAFGVPLNQIDHDRVRQSARKAQIGCDIESWDGQYETLVGERGVRLSGGQRQRIGIARALYKKADLIVFDEATSALDGETEQSVMESIEKLGDELTVIIVAHRLTTLKNCTKIVELRDGEILRTGSYASIVEHSKEPPFNYTGKI